MTTRCQAAHDASGHEAIASGHITALPIQNTFCDRVRGMNRCRVRMSNDSKTMTNRKQITARPMLSMPTPYLSGWDWVMGRFPQLESRQEAASSYHFRIVYSRRFAGPFPMRTQSFLAGWWRLFLRTVLALIS